MTPIIRTHFLRRAALLAACFASLAALGHLEGCKPVDLGGATQDTTTTSAGTATLRISNKLDVDPDSLVFLLFPGNASGFANAAGARAIGGVDSGATGVFTVPSGTWKLAYQNRAREITPMQSVDSDEWLKAILAKGGDYSLIVTSEAQHVRWDATFPTDPASP